MQRSIKPRTGADSAKIHHSFQIGQRVNVASRGRATISAKVLPGLWGVDFIDLEGFGYVFETEMTT